MTSDPGSPTRAGVVFLFQTANMKADERRRFASGPCWSITLSIHVASLIGWTRPDQACSVRSVPSKKWADAGIGYIGYSGNLHFLDKRQPQMDDLRIHAANLKAEFTENVEHRDVLGQNIGRQLLQSGGTS